MRVLAVASEIYPLVKTGGLADVVGALPPALRRLGVRVRTLVPGYPAVLAALPEAREVAVLPRLFGGDARILAGRACGLDLFALDAPHLFARDGGPYADAAGTDWPDNAQRFAALCRGAAAVALGALEDWRPDVVHAHDWQAGLVGAYVSSPKKRPPVVFTVHNLAFQGKFDAAVFAELGLPQGSFNVDGVEYYGGVGYLKAGLQYADRITTVSPTYATEITTPAWGMGLEGLLQRRSGVLSGILNGVDDGVWNPATDERIAATYDRATVAQRMPNKAALQERLGLDGDPAALLIGVVSRLTWQKGIDVLLDGVDGIVRRGAQLAVLGAGDAEFERRLRAAAAAHPGRIGCAFGYDEGLAHLIQAGADALLVPSRFEPCGLTQLYALRYGAVPVVARVGGLADTVVDANEMALAAGVATGVQFYPVDAHMLDAAVGRAAALFADPRAWARLQANGMRADVSWRRPARRYASLYGEALASRAERRSRRANNGA